MELFHLREQNPFFNLNLTKSFQNKMSIYNASFKMLSLKNLYPVYQILLHVGFDN